MKVNLNELKTLLGKGYNPAKCAKILGVSRAAISKQMKKIKNHTSKVMVSARSEITDITGPKKRVPLEEIIKMLEAKGGFMTATARGLGITLKTLENRIKKNKELQAALRSINERTLDFTESKLIEAVRDGQAWAICFHLKCKGKDRGWIERQEVEHSGPGGKPVVIRVIYEEKQKS